MLKLQGALASLAQELLKDPQTRSSVEDALTTSNVHNHEGVKELRTRSIVLRHEVLTDPRFRSKKRKRNNEEDNNSDAKKQHCDPQIASSVDNHEVIIIEDDDPQTTSGVNDPGTTSSVKDPQTTSSVCNHEVITIEDDDPRTTSGVEDPGTTSSVKDPGKTSSVRNHEVITIEDDDPRTTSGVEDPGTTSSVPDAQKASNVHNHEVLRELRTRSIVLNHEMLTDPRFRSKKRKRNNEEDNSNNKSQHCDTPITSRADNSEFLKDPQLKSDAKDLQTTSNVCNPEVLRPWTRSRVHNYEELSFLQTTSSVKDPQTTSSVPNHEVLRNLQTTSSVKDPQTTSSVPNHEVLRELRTRSIVLNHEMLTDPQLSSRKRERNTKKDINCNAKKQHSTQTDATTESDEVAIDCEMADIDIGYNIPMTVLISVAIVDSSMKLVYYAVCPPPGWSTVTCRSDLVIPRTRTFPPLITEQIQQAALKGVTFESVRSQVAAILDGKKVIGHSVDCDLRLLELKLPKEKVYDTHYHYTPKRCYELGLGILPWINRGLGFSLKYITKLVLGKSIQKGPHDAIEDTTATMALYLYDRSNFKSIGELGLTTGIRNGKRISFNTCYY